MSSSKPLPPVPPPSPHRSSDHSTDFDGPLPSPQGFYATIEAAWAPIDTPLRQRLPAIFPKEEFNLDPASHRFFLYPRPPALQSLTENQAHAVWKIGTRLDDFKRNLQHILKLYTSPQLLQWNTCAVNAMQSVQQFFCDYDSDWDCAGWVVIMGQAFAQHVASTGKLVKTARFPLHTIAHTLHGQRYTPFDPPAEPYSAFSSDSSNEADSFREAELQSGGEEG
ncbi:unnamed protein product [Cutaneotrichosporon oleaginosum]